MGDGGMKEDESGNIIALSLRSNASLFPLPRRFPSPDQPRVNHARRASPQNNVSSAAGARNTPNGTSGVSNGVDPSASSVCSRV